MRFKALLLLVAFIAFLAPNLFAQTTEMSGRYEGMADIQGTGKIDISADFRETNGKISGVIHSALGDAEIIGGRFENGILSITLDAGGDDLILNGKVTAGGFIIGALSSETINGTFELKRTGDLSPDSDSQPVIHQSKEKWREDLGYLAAELPKRHKNAFHRISRSNWDQLVADLDLRISSLSDEGSFCPHGPNCFTRW